MINLQTRLAKAQDNLRKKITDINIGLISDPVDCLHVKCERNFKGDVDLITPTGISIIQASFPPLEEIPYRTQYDDDGKPLYMYVSPVEMFEQGNEEKYFKLSIPYNQDIEPDDLIIQVKQDPDVQLPIIFILKVTELLGTFGGQKLVRRNVLCTINTMKLPPDILNAVMKLADRRKKVGY